MEIHLAQRALYGSQEVSFLEAIVTAADVIELTAQPLHLLKVEIQSEDL